MSAKEKHGSNSWSMSLCLQQLAVYHVPQTTMYSCCYIETLNVKGFTLTFKSFIKSIILCLIVHCSTAQIQVYTHNSPTHKFLDLPIGYSHVLVELNSFFSHHVYPSRQVLVLFNLQGQVFIHINSCK